ncbi:EEIG1/EHBP1 protein amine-terminal domain protein (macronuclear) [Tetrahymena thermophila SB210]|uniref:EEIG1/EHBP1 protein amine-terminal domain protein n=1 Tax=Tetrahymena thermophila (strain SB210) TaxID=312017 RepID=Q22A12_TETTS|nr:EEIG1/EHBP1 protein amine-terminal domain protein [Tetrahymena thermophila SB210]EAR82130.2 EEIG1/EHBP1 protein amine-terminal domain protein [Tetrahymena thermophila SB210]|eukprot:XP_001029793.2 EEIG1/EHBP1 protein amine-terminal domain protein [Tetrahymena thermophila SB210]
MNTNIQNIQAFKFNYDVSLQKITLAISFPCKIQVTLKRGTQKIESQQFDLENGAAKMEQLLNLQTNLYLDLENKTFLEKKATFTILIITPKGQKVAGTCQIDLAHYARNKITNKQESLKLEKCPDKNALFTFNIATSIVGQVEFDNMSMSSVASKAQNEYLTHEDVKKSQHSRNPSQNNLQLESEYKSPLKEASDTTTQSLSSKSTNQKNTSQLKEVQKQQENQNIQPVNGYHKEDDKLQKQFEIMKKQIEEYQNEKITFQKKIEFLQKSLTESEEKKNELLKEKQESIKQINNLNEILRNQSNGDEGLKKQCQNYEKQLQEKQKIIEKKEQLIQELNHQVQKFQDQIDQTQQQLNQKTEYMKTIQDLQSQITVLKKTSSQDDPKLKQKVEEQAAIILKQQSQIEQMKQETNDLIRTRVNEVYTQQLTKIEELETTNNQLRISLTKSEQNERLILEKKSLMEELETKNKQIAKLQTDLKNALDQSQTMDMLSNELVKSKQKLGDLYNRAMEIGVYEKLLQY